MSPRDSSGRSIFYPIKEEPTSLVTSSLSSQKANGKDPPRARNLFPLARAPPPKTPTRSTGPAPSLGTLTHVHQSTSAPVAHDLDPTLRNGPVVTPRTSARSAGRYSLENTEESRLSSSINSSEPPVLSSAVRAVPCDFTPKSDKTTARPPVGSGSRRASEAGRSKTGTLQAQRAGDWRPQTGTLQAHMPNTASDGLAPSTFDPYHPWVRARAVLPRPGVPRRGRCRPKVLETGVPRRGHYRLICLTRPPTGWHHLLLTLTTRGFGLAPCFRGRAFPDGDAAGPKCWRLVSPDGDITGSYA